MPMAPAMKNGAVNATAAMPTPRRIERRLTFSTPSNRPAIVMSDHLWFCGNWCGGYFSVQTSGCNDVTGFYMYFVNGARDPIGRREFPLLKTSFDVNVFALLVRH